MTMPRADYHIHNGRAKDAFDRHGCPACGADVGGYEPRVDDIIRPDLEWVRFDCDCELLVEDDGSLYIERQCPDATRAAIEDRVVFHDESAPLPDQDA